MLLTGKGNSRSLCTVEAVGCKNRSRANSILLWMRSSRLSSGSCVVDRRECCYCNRVLSELEDW